MFKVGDKVIPMSKSTGCSATGSSVLKRMEENKQQYLYIRKIIKDMSYEHYEIRSQYKGLGKNETIYVLIEDLYSIRGGDYFLERDIKEYIKSDREKIMHELLNIDEI